MIPKIIWQTHEPEFAALPMNYIINSRTIANKFHDWEYKYVSAEGRDSFVKSFFPEYYQYYSKIQHPIVQADFWRYLVLYEFGGMYCDIDSIYDVAIEHMVDKIDFTKDFYAISRDISLMDKNGLTNNSHIICSEKNLVMKQIIEEMIERFNKDTDQHKCTDPDMFHYVIEKNWAHVDVVTMAFSHGIEFKSLDDFFIYLEKNNLMHMVNNLENELLDQKFPKEMKLLKYLSKIFQLTTNNVV